MGIHAETLDVMRYTRDLANVHNKQECAGLPKCAACRAVMLIRHDYNVAETEFCVNEYAEGTKVMLLQGGEQ